ncbi:MAG: hypothetical protein ACKVH8_21800 [Pirellulales bacterium]
MASKNRTVRNQCPRRAYINNAHAISAYECFFRICSVFSATLRHGSVRHTAGVKTENRSNRLFHVLARIDSRAAQRQVCVL